MGPSSSPTAGYGGFFNRGGRGDPAAADRFGGSSPGSRHGTSDPPRALRVSIMLAALYKLIERGPFFGAFRDGGKKNRSKAVGLIRKG